MAKPALHEILAVEKTLEATANRLMVESASTFKKANLFQGTTRKLSMFDPAQSHLEGTEHQELTTTVDENLDYLVKPLSKYWNAVLQKDASNQLAKADITLDDGTVLAKDVPASFLLSFEKRLRELQQVYNAIPTLAPGRKWVEAQLERPGVYVDSDDAVQFKSQKDIEFRVVAEATKEHPAQIREVARTTNVGKYTTTELSGMLSPLEKAERLTRIDALINAVKRARMRANKQELVDKVDIGAAVFKYINQ
jgi:hypothetical protein